MKRRLTFSLTAMLLLVTSLVWGQAKVSVTDVLTRESTGVTGSNYLSWNNVTSNSDAVYAGQSAGSNNSIQLRSNNNNSGIITTASGGTVTGVSVVWNANTVAGRTLNVYGKGSAYTSPTELYNADSQGTLIGTIVCGTSTQLDISDTYEYIGVRSASGAMYLEEIDFIWSTGGTQQHVSVPTFSPAGGIYGEPQTVAISCATAGATIYYTTDGTTPTTASSVYSTPLTISETTTVKAMAAKAGMVNSNVATATYTIQEMTTITTIAGLWELATSVGTTATPANVTFNNWYVTGVKGGQVCVSDGQYGFVIYQSGHGFVAGDKLNGTVTCNVLLYQNHYAEVTGVHAADLTVVSNQEVPVLATTIENLVVQNYGTVIDLGTLTYTGTVFEDAQGHSITPYNNFNLSPNPVVSLTANTQYHVKGVSIIFWSSNNPTQQVAPRSADDFEEVTAPTNVVATPTFSPAGGTYSEPQTVTIACATTGAAIHYTIDGSIPTATSPLYTQALTISETTTVKAMATKAGMVNSNVATATYTIQSTPTPTLITIAEARALENNEHALVQGVVTFIDGRNVYIQDATAGIDLYLNSNTVPSTLAIGDLVKAYGAKAVFNGLVELTGINGGNNEEFNILSSGNTLPLAVKTIAEILADHANGDLLQATRVKIVDATIGAINTNNNTPITQDGSTMNIYKIPAVDGLLEGDLVTVTGVLGCYNNVQLRVNAASDVLFTHPQVSVVATPAFNPEGGEYVNSVTVAITCATEGAAIYYTTNGAAPTTSSTLYTQPIVLNQTTTLKAMAVKAGFQNSEVASATYTVTTPLSATFNKVMNPVDLNTTDAYLLVCESAGTAATGAIVNSALQTAEVTLGTDNSITTSYNATGYPYSVTLETAVGGYYLKINGSYLNNASGTNLSLGTTASTVWAANPYQGGYILQNIDNNNRFIGGSSAAGATYKAYAVNNLGSETYPFVVLFKEGETSPMQQVATPTITPNGGFFTLGQEVTLACTTEDASIYYTTDGTEPTVSSTAYTAAFTVNATATVKAIAVKEGMANSAVATATFTFPTLVTIAEARALPNNQYAYVEGVVTFIDGRNVYVQDATGGIDLYLNNNTVPSTLALGDKVRAYGKKTVFNGLVELTSINGGDENVFRVVSSGNLLPFAYTTVGECLAGAIGAMQSTRVTIQDAIIGAIHTNGNTILVQGNDTINIYKIPALTGITENSHVNVTAVIGYHNAPQLRVANATDVVLLSTNLTLTPTLLQGFTYEQGQGPSAAQSFTVSGQYLESTVTVTAGDNYEISTSASGTYGSTLTLSTNNGTLAETVLYVRLMAGLTMNNYNATITVSSGSDNATLALVGSVTIENAVETPTFTPEAGAYMAAQTVTILCTTPGAVLHYTLDGTDPTEDSPIYTQPIVLATTTTVKAMGVKANWFNSPVASATYEIHAPITIAEARVLDNNQYATVEGVVTHIDGRNVYVQDATAAIVLYLNNNTVPADLALGDLVRSYGKKSVYNGLVELTGINGGNQNVFAILSSGHNLPLANKTIAQILEDYNGDNMLQSTRVRIQNAVIGTINNNGNTPITQDGNEMNIYKLPVVEGLIAGDYVTVKGVVGCFNAAQLLVNSAADVNFTHRPTITASPLALTGFTYESGNGPSSEQSFVVSGERLESTVMIHPTDHFEISTGTGIFFFPAPAIALFPSNGVVEETTVYVRMKEGLAIGNYNNESVTLTSDNAMSVAVVCSGSVTDQGGQTTADWHRISSLSEIAEGDQIIIAARYDSENTNSYYAMTAVTSGKPEGVLCTTSMVGDDEVLCAEITNDADTYAWTLGRSGDACTLTNASGQLLGYTSSTNFATGGDNAAWTIVEGTSIDTGVMVPNYSAFNIINVNVTNRAAALNTNHNFGPYSTTNMTNGNGANYNFYLDIFVGGTGGTPTVNAPVFTPQGGTYYEAQEVELSCTTEDATIYYSLDSENGPWEEYTEAIAVSESVTIWAYAEKEGYNNSAVVSAEYVIIEGMVILFEQDWEGDWNGWTEVSVLGEPQWTIGSYSGNHYASANAYNQGATEDWLISPAFDLNANPDAILSFTTAKNYNGPDLEVYFSNDYDGEHPDQATWEPIVCPLSGGSWSWVSSGDISMSAFNGSNCYIGFRYTSTEDQAAGWEVDDIMLYAGGVAPTDPYLIATPNALTGFVHLEGQGPSEPQTFVLEGGNFLPMPPTWGTVTLSLGDLLPAYYEMSLDGENYSTVLTIDLDETLTLEPTTVYVRLNAIEVGQYDATIVIMADPDTYTMVTLSGEVLSSDQPYIDAFMPMYIQGNNGTNNNRVPIAVAVYLEDLEPNTTYRYTNQYVDHTDGPETPGAGNVIYASPDGFYRSTNPSLSTEGGYGEFTTDEYGEGFVWFMNEPTANTRFTPGNHVYLRIRINDGNDGTSVAHIFTTEDYATVLNFGTEYGENQGTAFYVKSDESPMNFVMMFSNDDDMRPTYSTSIETTGIDYAGISQYASFYQEEVAGKDGYFGGILPNDNPDGINIIWILDMESYVIDDYYTVNGLWGVTNTANPNAGLGNPLFIDLTDVSVAEIESIDVRIWNYGQEIVIENEELQGFEMTVYNILGQPLMTKSVAGQSQTRISHNFSEGLYIIKLQNNEKEVSTKILVR